jgi:hypothetical protein
MFQMDSNSGQPFFGVDLLRARKTAQFAPSGASSSSKTITQLRDGASSTRPPVATVSETTVSEPTLLERLKLKRPPERIPLALGTADDELPAGPVEEFR